MNIFSSHPSQAEQAGLAQTRRFEHPALALAQGFIRPFSLNIEIAGVFFGVVSLIALLKIGLEIYRLFIEPFSFPNLDF
jgi:hypothetical protein